MTNVLWSIPNLVTILRISLIPIFVLIFYCPFEWHYLASAFLFGLAAITDWLDGFLARKLRQISPFGTFLDPVADKLIVAVALVLLVQSHPKAYLAIPAAIIISREIAISALREWMAELGKRKEIAVQWVSRCKTAAQMISILLLLFENPKNVSWFTILGYGLLYIAVLLTLWSMFIYLRAAWKELSDFPEPPSSLIKHLPND